MTSISFAGIGRMGSALALALDHAGFVVDLLISHSANHNSSSNLGFGSTVLIDDTFKVDSDILLITTPDQFIRSTAHKLGDKIDAHTIVMHCSGSLSSNEIEHLREHSISIGSIHPLISVSDPTEGSKCFSGAYFCVEGDSSAEIRATEMIDSLQGVKISIPTDKKALYHAAAVMSSGHLTALLNLSSSLLVKSGVEGDVAIKMLMPLIKSTLNNIEQNGTLRALTGPFARNDIDALHRHLSAFEGNIDKSDRAVYLDLAERSVNMVKQSRPDDIAAQNLSDAINVEKKKLN